MENVGIAIPTYNGRQQLPNLLPYLRKTYPQLPILVVDSSSKDGTAQYARECGVKVEIIPQSDFNHGLTREFARKKLGTNIVVMMTQDAIPACDDLIQRLVKPILSGQAAVSYARQLPHLKAGFFESFPRDFSYSEKSYLRGIEDLKTYGSLTYFCSDSCAAWLNSALDAVGGFDSVLLGEDSVATARLLQKGFKIAYVAEALVRHSHAFSLLQEFKRYFDAGYERNRFRSLLFTEAGDEKQGSRYAATLFKRLITRNPAAIPYGFLHIASKYAGYLLGKNSRIVPQKFWKFLSSQPYYWSSKHFQKSSTK